MSLNFLHLNVDWNAEPNAPDPHVEVIGQDILLRFYVNPFQFKDFAEDEIGFLRFVNCWQYRLGPTNDEGWYHGQCRFSEIAPKWGEFYEVVGDDCSAVGPIDWRAVSAKSTSESHHFLFYFRDYTFECVAETCVLEVRDDNALTVRGKRISGFATGR